MGERSASVDQNRNPQDQGQKGTDLIPGGSEFFEQASGKFSAL